MTALYYPDSCRDLLLVSKAAYGWIDPLFHNARWLTSAEDLYAFEAFMTRCPKPLVDIHITALAFVFDSVSGLLVQLLLGHLKGLQALAVSSSIELAGHAAAGLTSFDLIDANHWHWVARNGTEAILASPNAFAKFGVALSEDQSLLPQLTHFAFSVIPPGSHIHAHAHLRHRCVQVLDGRRTLVIVVACGQPPFGQFVDSPISITSIQHPSFVILDDIVTQEDRLLDWRSRALGGLGFWDKAMRLQRIKPADIVGSIAASTAI
ncbi:hypothetical protein BKA62DRAFT_745485 [Auriculariales sp. MPI-PUGE-AT-0066]|nr:hypothetical protein BKA62DRAFT_745485 [Auriculariales sp. MPI-PUGE-AT-0066]